MTDVCFNTRKNLLIGKAFCKYMIGADFEIFPTNSAFFQHKSLPFMQEHFPESLSNPHSQNKSKENQMCCSILPSTLNIHCTLVAEI